jgi:Ni,Fe-hydrogenase I cytochrome b subunit
MVYNYLFYFGALIDQKAAGIPSASSFSLKNILSAVYFWAAVIAVVVIIIAGFFYVTSMDNPQQVTRAKNAILSAVIGLVVILLAFAITSAVIGGVT